MIKIMGAVIQYGCLLFLMRRSDPSCFSNVASASAAIAPASKKSRRKTSGGRRRISRPLGLAGRVDRVSFVLFPVVSGLLMVAYWIAYLGMRSQH